MTASLYDALLRHQTFLEGLKANQNEILEQDVMYIFNEFLKEIDNLNVTTLDELTRKKINEILSSMRQLIIRVYSKYTITFIEFLRRFSKVEANLTAMLIKETDTALPRFVPLKTFNKKFADELWAKIVLSEIPANGLAPIKYIDQLGADIYRAITKVLKMAVLNAEKLLELREHITGIPIKGGGKKGGLIKKFVNYAKSMVETSIQHVSSKVQNKIQSYFYDEYAWISVIDGHTTEVCTSRDQKVYRYGQGPLPPAHPRCRSKVIPRPVIPKDGKNYSEWFTDQPENVQNEMLTALKGLSLTEYEIARRLMTE